MSTINTKFFTPQDLRNIRNAVTGEGNLFKSVSPEMRKPEDGKQDVFILAPDGDIFKSANPADVARGLEEKGVKVQDASEGVLTARVSAEDKEKLEDLGFQVFDNSRRQMQPGIPQVTGRNGNSWDMVEVDPLKMTKADQMHQAGVTGKNQTVVVLDSGFDYEPYNDKLAGWLDVVNNSPTPHDGSGHGTHVIGDVLQTAPDANIIAIKVMGDDGAGRPSDILRGLKAVEKLKNEGVDIDVINMSLGGEPDGVADSLDPINRQVEKLKKQGITVIAAAGNSGPDVHTIGSPADAAGAIAIGSGLNEKTVSDFSSRGPTDDGLERPDLLAPGEFIKSWGVPYSEMYQTAEVLTALRKMPAEGLKELFTEKPEILQALGVPEEVVPQLLALPAEQMEQVIKPALPPMYLTEDGQVAAPGTSFAAPLTAGIAAGLEQVKDLSPEETRDVLKGTADNMGNFQKIEQGAGFVNAKKALDKVSA